MRPNQQNNKNRSRGRNNNGGRKHLNPLSRNYESNGPDVKVRGNASHVAEKYLQLARDAQSSGDSVMAENYLQHAEHYFRIVASAQAQQNQPRDQFGQPQGNADQEDDDDDFVPMNDRFASPEPPAPPAPPPQRFPQQHNQPQQGYEAGNTSQPAPAAVAEGEAEGGEPAVASAEGEGGEGQDLPRRHRDRRARRRGRGGAGGEGGGDPAGAPQPDVGELPAFLTGNPTPAE